jgi:hypothetical protein
MPAANPQAQSPTPARQTSWANNGVPVVSTSSGCAPTTIPPCCPPAAAPAQQAAPAPATTTETQQPQAAEAPATDSFAQAPEAGTEASASFNPQMIGDLLGFSAAIQVPITVGNSRTTRTVRVPISSTGSFKIADNESPRPVDRVYFGYNYFNNVNGSFRGDVSAFDVHQELVGFEKTFCHGDASIGLRLPFTEFAGDAAVESTKIDDLSVIFKYAFYNDPRTYNVMSAGLLVTVPTGQPFNPIAGSSIHPTIFLPYTGFIYNWDRFYAHGFLSLETSTDLRIPTIMFNDIGVGFWLYRVQHSQLFTSIVPTVEAHVNTPLSKRGVDQDPVGFTDQIILTGGIHFTMFHRGTLSFGASAAVTGPQPYDLEAFAQFNYRF